MNTHCSTWYAELIIPILKEIGFSEVRETQFAEETDTGLCKDSGIKNALGPVH